MSRAERAKEYFLQGYACSQAVALAFSDVMGVSKEVIAKMMLPFGGGMGRLRLTCGAVSGMAAVIGMVFAKDENTPENKKQTYAITQQLCEKFKEANGSLICAELLTGIKNSESGDAPKKRSCAEMVALAAQLVEERLKQEGIL